MVDVAGTERQAGPPNRLRAWLAGLQLSQLTQILTLVVLAATALFGGLDTVDRRVTVGEPGTAFSDGEFTVTIERASLVPEVRTGTRVIAKAKPGRTYLGVVTQLRNDGTAAGSLQNEITLLDQPDAEFIGPFRLTDGEPVARIGPGLTEDLVFIWSLPEDAVAAGESVTLQVPKKTFNELLTTYGKAWIPSLTDYTKIVVGVKVPS